MLERATSNTPVAKAIRLVLVFSLVFWMSFRVECLAFAGMLVEGVDGHENDVLVNMEVRTAAEFDGGWEVSDVAIRDAQGGQQTQDVNVSSAEGTVSFVAVPTWEAKPDSGGEGGSEGGDSGGSSGGSGDDNNDQNGSGGNNGGGNNGSDDDGNGDGEGEDGGEGEGEGDGVDEPRAIVAPQADGDTVIAKYVKWEIVEGADYAEISTNEDGVATLTGKGTKQILESGSPFAKVTVICSLNGASPEIGESAGDASVSFDVTIQAPYVGAIDIMKQGGDEPCGSDVLEIDRDQEYQFWAQVQVNDPANNGNQHHDITPGNGLGSIMNGVFGELKWEVLDAEGKEKVEDSVATLTEEGALTLKGDGPVIVKCFCDRGPNGEPIAAQVTVKAKGAQDDPAARQGKSNPQNELTVVIEQPKAAEAEGDQNSGEAANPDASSESAPSGESANSGEGASGESSGESAEPSGSSEAAEAAQDITKTFDVAALEKFDGGFGEETYELSVDGKQAKISGKGVTIPRLLSEAGLPLREAAEGEDALAQDNIESIDFVNADGITWPVAWSDLIAVSQSYPMLAVQAYVHPDAASEGEQAQGEGEGEGQGEGEAQSQSGEQGSEKITYYDNTRFQLLYNGGSGSLSDGGSLRWINKIVVHTKAKEAKPDNPPMDDVLRVSISYAPVAKDHVATLTALPSGDIQGLSYGLTWQRSVDGGKTWDVYNDESVQSIQIMTDDGHIGNQFRVILEANDIDKETGENRKTTSEPVEIKVADESKVVIDYIPPIAGNIAEFVARFETAEADSINTSNPKYYWEWRFADESDWHRFEPDETGQTLRIPTTAIEQSEASEGSEARLMLIHVTAIVPDHEPLVSEPVPFTVRTGDSSGTSKKADDIAEQLNKNNNNNNNNNNDQNNKSDETSDIEDIDDDYTDYPDEYPDDAENVEDVEEPEEPETDAAPVSDEPATQVSVTEIPSPEINKEVTNQAKKKKTVNKPDPSTPGAKWTEISARPSSEDIQNALADNPFAPFAIPMGLGITVAGGLEKLLVFRRQLG